MNEALSAAKTDAQDAALEVALETGCVIAGAGPGGLMLGLLLARAGVDVTVVEKHADFLRDFRGDTIHPSTLEVLEQMGLAGDFFALPHTKAEKLHAEMAGKSVTIADFTRLPVKNRFIAFMPQWDFLNFLADHARQYPNFRLITQAKVEELLYDQDRVSGIRVTGPQGRLAISARLVVGADGRNSTVRALAGLEVESFGTPSDVLWMKLSHLPSDPPYTMGHGGPRQGFVMIDRGDYWQCGYVVRKGSYAEVKEKGIEAFRTQVAAVSPLPAERMMEISSFDDVSLLSIRIDRLKRWWRPGLICIGDAAHAMSPIGGVGVNLAIQDAVAAANYLAGPLRKGQALEAHLQAIEKRRTFPTKATQKLQLMMKGAKRKQEAKSVGTPNSAPPAGAPSGPPAFVRWLAASPILSHLAGRLIGLGFRPEKIRFENE